MAVLAKIEENLDKAPSLKGALVLSDVQERFIANYQAVTGKKDGENRFQSELFAYLDIISEKPDLQKLPRFQHFKAVIRAATTGLSFRDNKLYIMPGPNSTIKIQSSPHGKREQLEMMADVKMVPEPQLVLKGDEFVYDKLNNKIEKHTSKNLDPKWDDIIASYQRIIWKDGTVTDVVVTRSELENARKKTKTKSDDSPWNTWPGEMCKKVATNRAFNRYHQYPDNIITYGADNDKHDEADTTDIEHQVQQEVKTGEQVEAKVQGKTDSETEQFLNS